MKKFPLSVLALMMLALAPAASARAQSQGDDASGPATRPRTVGAARPQETSVRPAPTPSPVAGPAEQRTTPVRTTPAQDGIAGAPSASPATGDTGPIVTQPVATTAYVPLKPARPLPVSRARQRITEAERLFKSRVSPTAMTSTTSAAPPTWFVSLAVYDQEASEIHVVSLPKQTFLTRGAEVVTTTSRGMNVRLHVVRPNYVNTAVVVSELMTGRQLNPLLVEYPIEKFGRFTEMAYYTSAHPALLSPEVVNQGKAYVRTMLDLATKRLRDKGKIINPQLVDIAERLVVVEHVDHDRFRREDRGKLYEEVYALFALNELDTYRYSVSSAGAGGMVQMIPSTYQMVRRLHPGVGLNPDFVAGMRNHGNALEAMLLYVQDTWNGLALNQQVLEAMAGNYATQTELVAAGYNSNPARLPLYIRRGGAAWRTLIPRETQIYLQIYKSVESLIEFKNRAEKN